MHQYRTSHCVGVRQDVRSPCGGRHHCGRADGCATKVRTELEIYARRAWWNIGQPGVMPSPSDYRAVTTWEVRALGRDASTSFKLAYHAFWGRREANTLPRRVPPPPAEPFSLADAKELLEFWRAIATGPSDSAPVGVAALRALTIPMSQTWSGRSACFQTVKSTIACSPAPATLPTCSCSRVIARTGRH